jgi:hypothetical protein
VSASDVVCNSKKNNRNVFVRPEKYSALLVQQRSLSSCGRDPSGGSPTPTAAVSIGRPPSSMSACAPAQSHPPAPPTRRRARAHSRGRNGTPYRELETTKCSTTVLRTNDKPEDRERVEVIIKTVFCSTESRSSFRPAGWHVPVHHFRLRTSCCCAGKGVVWKPLCFPHTPAGGRSRKLATPLGADALWWPDCVILPDSHGKIKITLL